MTATESCGRCGAKRTGVADGVCPACLMELGLSGEVGPGDRLGPYAIVAAIGAGGMGQVFRARDDRLRRDVALKVLPATVAADPERLSRFEREAQAASALNHPNIMAVYDVGTQDGRPYIVTELLEGQTLRERLAGGPLGARKTIEYAGQIARGLAAAHGKGIVHRDLKPENLFVTADEQVKILDFGVAKLGHDAAAEMASPTAPTQQRLTEPGTVLGTVGYMSPEQVRGEVAESRSDIFSFGTVLHEMLTGRHPFQRASAGETMAAILKEEPAAPSGSTGGIPPALDALVLHCLEKSPAARFQSASDVAFQLSTGSATAVSGPAAALPAKRGKALAGVAAVVLLATFVALWYARHRVGDAAGVRRVAVLPFENQGSSEDDYFADGIADQVRGKLTSVPGIEVIARGSSTPYKKTTKTPQEIAKELSA
ncbi:MAG TPA: serine/threonine-protein kinase, partial [Thermoanaerobaculia bacterium]|nr:serine/threonine-protein kinase [Thermoanaerobaculia bacterium]